MSEFAALLEHIEAHLLQVLQNYRSNFWPQKRQRLGVLLLLYKVRQIRRQISSSQTSLS
jgi:hypothetical protein